MGWKGALRHEVVATLSLLLPLLGGALLHGLCLRYGWFGFLARPIDGGRTLRGKAVFGHSKTFRGPLAVAAGAGAVWAIERTLAPPELGLAGLPGWWFGALLGGAAELAELPNSFVKRRLGIAPGATARGALAVVFYLWDQLDVLLGFWLLAACFVPVTPLRIAVSVVIASGIHPLLTVAGYLLGMRPTLR
jgi:hypothetical protein